ncbi:MAG: hypothetical protein EZS28_028851 [Streblomastix strix]|uniref:Uncharacterized protein n=1 Tax=Streblomastix strix TaxID=222440 RepID=A0A5J4UZN5_9EUKA|nr:MAG: hypothetical protein EZS28_028851 [Streblomastix strix]
MAVLGQYNEVDGFLGLDQDILLEIVTQMQNLDDVQQGIIQYLLAEDPCFGPLRCQSSFINGFKSASKVRIKSDKRVVDVWQSGS